MDAGHPTLRHRTPTLKNRAMGQASFAGTGLCGATALPSARSRCTQPFQPCSINLRVLSSAPFARPGFVKHPQPSTASLRFTWRGQCATAYRLRSVAITLSHFLRRPATRISKNCSLQPSAPYFKSCRCRCCSVAIAPQSPAGLYGSIRSFLAWLLPSAFGCQNTHVLSWRKAVAFILAPPGARFPQKNARTVRYAQPLRLRSVRVYYLRCHCGTAPLSVSLQPGGFHG